MTVRGLCGCLSRAVVAIGTVCRSSQIQYVTLQAAGALGVEKGSSSKKREESVPSPLPSRRSGRRAPLCSLPGAQPDRPPAAHSPIMRLSFPSPGLASGAHGTPGLSRIGPTPPVPRERLWGESWKINGGDELFSVPPTQRR